MFYQTSMMIPSDPFKNFTDNIDKVTNDRELGFLIAHMGLYNKQPLPSSNMPLMQFPPMIHPRFRRFTYSPNEKKGIWNDPDTFANFLWSNKDAWKQANVQSCLEIGTFTGYGFFVMSTFMKTFVNPNMTFKTIDIVDIDQTDPVYNYVKDYFQKTDSDGLAGESFDLVFIDGSTEKEWLKKDFDNTKAGAKQIFFLATPGMREMRFNQTVFSNIMSAINQADVLTQDPRSRFHYVGVKGAKAT